MSQDFFSFSRRNTAMLPLAGYRFYGLMVDHAAHLASLQLDVMTACTAFTLDQFRSLQTLAGSSACQEYLKTRESSFDRLSQRLSGDADGMASLQRDLAAEWQKITRENVISFAEAAAVRDRFDAAD